MLEDDKKLYLIRETKSTLDNEKLRDLEGMKIRCGLAHFDALGVDYMAVDTPEAVVMASI